MTRLWLVFALTFAGPALAAPQTGSDPEAELEALLAEERAAARDHLRRGEREAALDLLGELLEDDPGDHRSRRLRVRALEGQREPGEVAAEARRALEDALEAGAGPEDVAACAREAARLSTRIGAAEAALELLQRAGEPAEAARDPRNAWAWGEALVEAGERTRGREAWRTATGGPLGSGPWDALLARGRCERALGLWQAASISLVAADRAARAAGGAEPDVLAELAGLYFEVDGEVDRPETANRRPGPLLKEALGIDETHAPTLLGLFELARFNWRRQSVPSSEWLARLMAAHPASVEGWLARARAALDDGHLPRARGALDWLEEHAPGLRAVRAERAALAWVEHDRDRARRLLDELTAEDPLDAGPELAVGRHLLELYRFAEAVPFLEDAAERDDQSPEVWTQLGRAYANTGDEDRGLEALERAVVVAGGRENAWRNNMLMVLRRLRTSYEAERSGEHTHVWEPDAAFVLGTYLVPFYAEARDELARRYGFTPGEVRIEFFGRYEDFSVRSTGFTGFPALGVCFGPVVTAVSPLAELRGTFSWARTAFHEYTHVIHLGLSHNRCPRWITEGIATWEEGTRDPAWWRNMRRDLVDAYANDDLIPVRELNAAFRGPRILFGYYQGGLLVQMLVRDHGFPPMIRLLEAFDEGADLDTAFREVFGRTPEDVDARFSEYVAGIVGELEIEPRWSPSRIAALRFSLGRRPPEEPDERAAWAAGWTTVAWGSWQSGRRVDAEEALRRADAAADLPPRASFLRAEIALERGDREAARELFEAGLAAGGDSYRARMVLGGLAMQRGELDLAEEHFLAAERCFPGFPDAGISAELALVQLYESRDQEAEAMEARRRWLAFEPGDLPVRLVLGRWLLGEERFEEAVEVLSDANEVDPFHSGLHRDWARGLVALERWDEVLREVEVALRVPADLDSDPEAPFDDAERAELLGLRARAQLALGRLDAAREAAEAALALDPDEERAREVLGSTP